MKHSGIATEWSMPADRPEAIVKFGTDSERTLDSSEVRVDLSSIPTTLIVRAIEKRAGLIPVAIIRFSKARWKQHLRLTQEPETTQGFWSGTFNITRGLLPSEVITLEYALVRDLPNGGGTRLVWRELLGTIKGQVSNPKIGAAMPVWPVAFSTHHDSVLNGDPDQPWRYKAEGEHLELYVNTDAKYFPIHRLLKQGLNGAREEIVVARAMYAGVQITAFTLYALALALQEITETGITQLSADSPLKKYLTAIFGVDDYPTDPIRLTALIERKIRSVNNIDKDLFRLSEELNQIMPTNEDSADVEATAEEQE